MFEIVLDTPVQQNREKNTQRVVALIIREGQIFARVQEGDLQGGTTFTRFSNNRMELTDPGTLAAVTALMAAVKTELDAKANGTVTERTF